MEPDRFRLEAHTSLRVSESDFVQHFNSVQMRNLKKKRKGKETETSCSLLLIFSRLIRPPPPWDWCHMAGKRA